MLISIWRNFRESSTTPFDVGSTRWSGFRRLKIKIDDVDAKIFFHLRKSSYLFKIGCGGVVVWWNREEVALHHSTASHLSCVPLKCSLSPVPRQVEFREQVDLQFLEGLDDSALNARARKYRGSPTFVKNGRSTGGPLGTCTRAACRRCVGDANRFIPVTKQPSAFNWLWRSPN